MTFTKQRSYTLKKDKIVLVCTGPTAAWVDYRKLNIPIFGMNHAHKITDRLTHYANLHPNLTPAHIVAVSLPKENIFTQEGETWGTQIHGLPGHEFKTDVFSQGVSGFYGSSVFQVIQIIYSIGFREIYIVGMDARTEDKFIHAYPESLTEKDFETARTLYKDMQTSADLLMKTKPQDLEIFNCSPISAIKTFPYFDISKLYQ